MAALLAVGRYASGLGFRGAAGEQWCPNLRQGHPENEHSRRTHRML